MRCSLSELGAGERKQGAKIVVIGFAKRGDIAFSRFAGISEVHAAPAKSLAAQRYQ